MRASSTEAPLGVELGEPRFDDDGYDAKLAASARARVDGRLVHVRLPVAGRRRAAAGGRARGVGDGDVGRRGARCRGRAAPTCSSRRAPRPAAIAATSRRRRPTCRCSSYSPSVRDAPARRSSRRAASATGGRAAALAAGAAAVQAGTAFLLCPEAGTSEPHRAALDARRRDGDHARVHGPPRARHRQPFMRDHPHAPSAYPQSTT